LISVISGSDRKTKKRNNEPWAHFAHIYDYLSSIRGQKLIAIESIGCKNGECCVKFWSWIEYLLGDQIGIRKR